MLIGIAQINPTVGDLKGNAAIIRKFAARAVDSGCRLLLTPEMVLTGYPPQDLLFKQHFIDQQLGLLQELSKELSIPAVIGCIDQDSNGRLFNSAAVLVDGQINHVHKSLLPRDDVFDERRYFEEAESNGSIEIGGVNFGLTICEDIWDENYSSDVVPGLCTGGAEVLVNISSSPFHSGKMKERFDVCRRHAVTHNVPVIYCNTVGGQDELVFDGGSFAMDNGGFVREVASRTTEELLIIDINELAVPSRQSDPEFAVEEEFLDSLCLGVRDYFAKCGFSKAVIGISGGVDSALVAWIAAKALGPKQVIGVAMPSRFTADMSNDDAATLAQNIGIGFEVMPIEDSVLLAQERYQSVFGRYNQAVTAENLQARERGKILMEISNDQNALVLSTGNKTEYALGYTTLYGDMCGGLAVIGDVTKPLVYALCRYVNLTNEKPQIPERILTRPPSAELRENQVDPFDYDRFSPLVDLIIEQHCSKSELLDKQYIIEEIDLAFKLVRLSEYKRKQAPPILRISKRAFGIGRRMPIVNRFDQ